ncbi:MAG TPA: ATPase, T2SS/T4P/T4SS family [Acidimicrobiia bacterium]|nr:ATPase, T2SS/T4P/T4SS family [Acidimicrobiia bacterium]
MTTSFLQSVLDDPLVEEVIVLGGHRTFVVRDGVKALLPDVVEHEEVQRLVERLLAGTGRRLDLASPIVSAQLADGSRVHVAGPPVTQPGRLNVQIRRFVLAHGGLEQLVERGAMPAHLAVDLAAAVYADRTILIAGAPGAGKTTLVNCLLAEVPPDRRVVTCEEVFEISVDLPDMTQMQTRERGLDGGGEITLRDLVRASLRQRPDRIVVGEVRGPEALDLVLALNAGCSGLATLHANSAVDALDKLVGYCVLAGQNVVVEYVRSALAAVTDLVVFLRRIPQGRRVEQVIAVEGWEGTWRHRVLYSADQP